MILAETSHQSCLIAVKIVVIWKLPDLRIIVPATEINIVNEVNSFQKVFQIL